jgi:hypothetical protein
VKKEVIEGLEAFTCVVYSRSRFTKVEELLKAPAAQEQVW